MNNGITVRIHWICEIEPAVVNVLLLTVGQGIYLARLGQFVPIFDLGNVETGTFLCTCVFLFSFIEGSTLNTFSVKTQIITFKVNVCLKIILWARFKIWQIQPKAMKEDLTKWRGIWHFSVRNNIKMLVSQVKL